MLAATPTRWELARYISVYTVFRSAVSPARAHPPTYRGDMGELTLVEPAPPRTTPHAGRARGWARLIRLYWLLPALLTLALGLWRARRPALWADELATWGAVRLSWGQLWQLLGHIDATVGPYYLGLKLWTALAGTGNLALRLPSIGAMAVTAALVALLGERLAERSRRVTGLVAGLLFAVVPATSRYAQEARPYAFTMLLAALATLVLTRLVRRPGGPALLGYALCVTVLGAAHLIALLLLPAHGLAVLALRRRRVLACWALGAGLALLLVAPLAVIAVAQRDQVAWIGPANWRTLLATPETLFTAGITGGAIILLAIVGAGRRWPTALLGSWALVPPVALLLLSQVTPLYWARYLLFTLPAWVVAAALALTRLAAPAPAPALGPAARSRIPVLGDWWRAAAVVVVVALLGGPTQHEIRRADGHLHATSAVGAIIAANAQPGDGLVVALHETPEPWEARDIVARYVPPGRTPTDVFAVTPQRTDGQLLATECADLTACLDRANPRRLWVIRFEARPDPLAKLGQPKEDLLRSRYHVQQLWLVRGLTVALLVRNP